MSAPTAPGATPLPLPHGDGSDDGRPPVHSPDAVLRRGPLFWVSAVVGAAGVAWGLRGVFTHSLDTRPANLGKFFLGGVILHDAVFAPLVLAAGIGVAMAVPRRVRAQVQAGLIIIGCVVLFAYPEVRGYGLASNNPTSLPYNYAAKTATVVLAVVAAMVVAAIGHLFLRHRTRPDTPRQTSANQPSTNRT